MAKPEGQILDTDNGKTPSVRGYIGVPIRADHKPGFTRNKDKKP